MRYDTAINMAVTAVICDMRLPQGMKEEIIDGLTEVKRLAEIGKAVEKAFVNNEYCIASYKGNHLNSFKTISKLLKWAESEEE